MTQTSTSAVRSDARTTMPVSADEIKWMLLAPKLLKDMPSNIDDPFTSPLLRLIRCLAHFTLRMREAYLRKDGAPANCDNMYRILIVLLAEEIEKETEARSVEVLFDQFHRRLTRLQFKLR